MRAPFQSLGRMASVLVIAATIGLVACGAPGGPSTQPPATAPATTATTSSPAGTDALVARPAGPVHVFAQPAAGTPFTTLPPTTGFGSARALLVTGRLDGWLRVQLPIRPNGAAGWIRSAGVPVRSVPFEVRVDLSDRSLEVLEAGRSIMRTSAAVGTAAAPTPEGRFFVVDKVETGSATSAYGPFALGLSAHSDVLSEFAGGNGQIGIHGTTDPSSIGRAASSGCVRVPNDVITRLAGLIPLGTPVVIVG